MNIPNCKTFLLSIPCRAELPWRPCSSPQPRVVSPFTAVGTVKLFSTANVRIRQMVTWITRLRLYSFFTGQCCFGDVKEYPQIIERLTHGTFNSWMAWPWLPIYKSMLLLRLVHMNSANDTKNVCTDFLSVISVYRFVVILIYYTTSKKLANNSPLETFFRTAPLLSQRPFVIRENNYVVFGAT